jgi:multidrug efflux pump subunit AcrA (membrane-fusion protein)
VNADNTVTQRNVTLGQRQGDLTVINSGVAAADRVVTAGQLGLTTGMKVNPSAWTAPK